MTIGLLLSFKPTFPWMKGRLPGSHVGRFQTRVAPLFLTRGNQIAPIMMMGFNAVYLPEGQKRLTKAFCNSLVYDV